MSYSHEMLIDQTTGEFDWTYIKRQSVIRADREFGAVGAPNSWVRDAIRHHKAIAEIMRRRWRAERGLPDDTVYVTVSPLGARDNSIRSAF